MSSMPRARNWQRREGSFAACGSWILKVGGAIGSWASGEILDATGFDQALGGNQTSGAIFSIRFFLAVIPVVGLVMALVCLNRFPLTPRRMAEIRAHLEERRGKV
jgi:glycoside/pentoside/hexuronide:cation symporter, GPH family